MGNNDMNEKKKLWGRKKTDEVPQEDVEGREDGQPKKKGKIKRGLTWLKTRRKRTKALIAILLVVVIVAGGLFHFRRKNARKGMAAVAVQSATASTGSLSTTVEGTGTLANADSEDLQVPVGLKIKKVKVDTGDEVQKGDTLATVDKTSLLAALEETQEELDEVNESLSDEADNDTTKYVESAVEGRVKKIYAEKNVDVSTTILNKGALMLISLDGKMAVDVETSVSLTVGQEVQVRLSDGDSVTGTVTNTDDSSCTVTVTDKGTKYKDSVVVYTSSGKKVGTGELYINKESKVTATSGTVKSILVSENEYVDEGDNLLKLKGDFQSEEYLSLEEQKEDLEEKLESLLKISKHNTITASEAGIITAVNLSDNTVSGSSSDSSSSSSSSSSSDSSSTISGLTGTSAVISGSSSKTAKSADSSSKTSGLASGKKTVTAVMLASVKDTANADTAYSVSAKNTVAAVKLSGAATGVSEDPASENSTGSSGESLAQSEDDSAGESSTTEESTVTQISSIGSLGVTAPVTGAQPETSVSGSAYSGSISWSPSASAFAAETAYTAKVVLTAASGYGFSENISIGSSGATVSGITVSGSGEGNTVSFTLSYAKTAKAQSTTEETDTTEQTSTAKKKGSQATTGTKGTTGAAAGGQSGSSGISLSGSASSASAGSAGTSSSTTASSSTDSDTNTELTTAFSISSGEEMTLSVSVDEMDILSVSVGQTAKVTLDAVEDEEFEGEITGIDKNGTASGGTTKYPVEITLSKEDSMIAGMNASVTITISEVTDALLIPSSAITEEGNTSYVYTEKDAESGELSGKTEVTTGLTDGTNTAITSGLSEGDTVYYTGISGGTESDSDSSDSDSKGKNGFGGGGGDFSGGGGGGTPPSGGNGGGPGGM